MGFDEIMDFPVEYLQIPIILFTFGVIYYVLPNATFLGVENSIDFVSFFSDMLKGGVLAVILGFVVPHDQIKTFFMEAKEPPIDFIFMSLLQIYFFIGTMLETGNIFVSIPNMGGVSVEAFSLSLDMTAFLGGLLPATAENTFFIDVLFYALQTILSAFMGVLGVIVAGILMIIAVLKYHVTAYSAYGGDVAVFWRVALFFGFMAFNIYRYGAWGWLLNFFLHFFHNYLAITFSVVSFSVVSTGPVVALPPMQSVLAIIIFIGAIIWKLKS